MRFRDPVLHIIHEFHLGDLRKVIIILHARDLDGNLLHRDLAAKIDHDLAESVLRYRHLFSRKQRFNPFRHNGNFDRVIVLRLAPVFTRDSLRICNLNRGSIDRIVLLRIDYDPAGREAVSVNVKHHRHRRLIRDLRLILPRQSHSSFTSGQILKRPLHKGLIACALRDGRRRHMLFHE